MCGEENFCLTLICQALRVKQFCIVWSKFESIDVVSMCFIKFLFPSPIEKHVTSVEKNRWIFWVLVVSYVKVCLSLFELVKVIISQTPIIVVHSTLRIMLDSFLIIV